MVPHSVLANRSASVRPARIVLRDIGKVRNRSITPVDRSLLNPTAVPIDAVVRFITTSPPMAKST